jgi:hypothetical protein
VDHRHHLSLPDEPGRSRPLRALLALLALIPALVLALVLAACAPGGGGDGGSTSDTTTSNEPAPEPEPTTEDPDPTTGSSSSSNGNPAISVARLPVGGGSELREDDPTLQCAEVSWIVDNNGEIPRGIAVELITPLFTPEVFRVVRGGCGSSQPNCIGYIFRSSAQRCDLLVRLVGTIPDDTSPSVGFTGLVYCPRNDAQSCRQFVAALGDQQQISVQLTVPPPPEPEPDPEPETT